MLVAIQKYSGKYPFGVLQSIYRDVILEYRREQHSPPPQSHITITPISEYYHGSLPNNDCYPRDYHIALLWSCLFVSMGHSTRQKQSLNIQ